MRNKNSSYLCVEEFSNDDIIRHFILLPNGEMSVGKFQGFGCVAMTPEEAQQWLSKQPNRIEDMGSKWSEDAQVYSFEYSIVKQGRVWKISLSHGKINFYKKWLRSWYECYTRENSDGSSTPVPINERRETYEQWLSTGWRIEISGLQDRNWIISDTQDACWQVGILNIENKYEKDFHKSIYFGFIKNGVKVPSSAKVPLLHS